jgi:phenylpyruvate tautomerase PptA (4-oxalocrotonate tautomerase family)
MTFQEAAKRAKRQERCVLRVVNNDREAVYIIRQRLYEIGPDGHPRPYQVVLDDFDRDDWYASDDA